MKAVSGGCPGTIRGRRRRADAKSYLRHTAGLVFKIITSANPRGATVIFFTVVFRLRNDNICKNIYSDFIVNPKVLRGRPPQTPLGGGKPPHPRRLRR